MIVQPISPVVEFLSAAIEAYKIKHGMSGKEAANLFAQYGVLDFLADGYDLLHTQSLDYVVGETEAYMRNRGRV